MLAMFLSCLGYIHHAIRRRSHKRFSCDIPGYSLVNERTLRVKLFKIASHIHVGSLNPHKIELVDFFVDNSCIVKHIFHTSLRHILWFTPQISLKDHVIGTLRDGFNLFTRIGVVVLVDRGREGACKFKGLCIFVGFEIRGRGGGNWLKRQ